jgi:hypothetical protein
MRWKSAVREPGAPVKEFSPASYVFEIIIINVLSQIVRIYLGAYSTENVL